MRIMTMSRAQVWDRCPTAIKGRTAVSDDDLHDDLHDDLLDDLCDGDDDLSDDLCEHEQRIGSSKTEFHQDVVFNRTEYDVCSAEGCNIPNILVFDVVFQKCFRYSLEKSVTKKEPWTKAWFGNLN